MKNKMNYSKLILTFLIFISYSCTKENKNNQWKISIQMWTFHYFSFIDALNKVDSAGIRYIEAYPGQILGGDYPDAKFGYTLNKEQRLYIKSKLKEKNIELIAFGVIVTEDINEWDSIFEFSKDMAIDYITTEPNRNHWDKINELAGKYKIPIAIHDHPKPSAYQHPDSVIEAMTNRENIGVVADIGHWARNGLNVVECLKMVDGKIMGLHLKDINEFDNINAEDVILGTGICDIPAVAQELKRQKFDGFFSIEHETNWFNNIPDIIKNREFIEEQMNKK